MTAADLARDVLAGNPSALLQASIQALLWALVVDVALTVRAWWRAGT